METKQAILDAMKTRISQITGRDAGALDGVTTFEELNLKNANYSQITTFLEDEADVQILLTVFKKNRTLGEAADYVLSLMAGTPPRI